MAPDHRPLGSRLAALWRRLLLVGCPLFAGLLGTGIALWAILGPNGLYGITQYDDGVYFGASLHLLSGVVPYRDFVFVQPPGITLAMAPFALLAHATGTAAAMATVRIATAVVVGLNAALAALLLAPRGRSASLAGGSALAIFPPAFFADHSLLLEPYVVLFCLLGALFALQGDTARRPRRYLAAGLALGFGGAVKLWAVVPAAVLLIVLAARGRKALGRYVTGLAVGFGLPCLPFFLGAPGPFLHDVFVSQFSRGTKAAREPLMRLFGIVGLHGLSLDFSFRTHRHAGVVVVAVLGALLALALLVTLLRRQRLGAVELFSLLAALGTAGLLFLPVEYFDHYAYFPGAFVALALGAAVGRLVEGTAALLRPGRSTPRRAVAAVLALVALVAAGLGTAHVVASETRYDRSALQHDLAIGGAIGAVLPKGACVVTDDEALVIEANRFFADGPDCPVIDDADGTWLAEDPKAPTGTLGAGDASLVALWERDFSRAAYVVLRTPHSFRVPFTPALRQRFNSDFGRIGGGSIAVYQRRVVPAALTGGTGTTAR